jgi:hypothetical protein
MGAEGMKKGFPSNQSATKCRQLKLRPTLERLPAVIHEVSEGIFGVLCKSLD